MAVGYLASVVEKEASSAISVLGITRVEALLANQRSLLVSYALITRQDSINNYSMTKLTPQMGMPFIAPLAWIMQHNVHSVM